MDANGKVITFVTEEQFEVMKNGKPDVGFIWIDHISYQGKENRDALASFKHSSSVSETCEHCLRIGYYFGGYDKDQKIFEKGYRQFHRFKKENNRWISLDRDKDFLGYTYTGVPGTRTDL